MPNPFGVRIRGGFVKRGTTIDTIKHGPCILVDYHRDRRAGHDGRRVVLDLTRADGSMVHDVDPRDCSKAGAQ